MIKNQYHIPLAFLAMILIVAASNYLVQFPINDWLTYGAFIYPVSFFVTELTNRFQGPAIARKIVYAGFACAVIISVWLSTPRIAIASGLAFLISQLLDIYVFNRLRQFTWWYAPFYASLAASAVDTWIFWTIAFLGEPVPFLTWSLGDFSVKLAMDLIMLTPFRLAIRKRSTTPCVHSEA